MKGIILAGGTGSRLYPATKPIAKSLLPVYDKPMIYYPLCTLMELGIREICVITTPFDQTRFQLLLDDGSQWGLQIQYAVQEKPRGIAEAFLIAEGFISHEPVTLILGDNLFFGGFDPSDLDNPADPANLAGALLFAIAVHEPQRYGVIELSQSGQALSIEEKPKQPKSRYAIPGLYRFDNNVTSIVKALSPSSRNELEITDVSREYLKRGLLAVRKCNCVWLDAGISASLHEASAYVQTIQKRTETTLGCPEETSLRKGYITREQFEKLIELMPHCEYRTDLKSQISDLKSHLREGMEKTVVS